MTVERRPGIYSLSLDAGSRLAVAAARRLYRLPYFAAAMRVLTDGEWIDYASRRVDRAGPPATLSVRYRPRGQPRPPEPGSLEHFLTERYCLYTLDDQRRVLRGDIHHPPWPLQPAEAELRENSMARPFGIDLAGEPLLHFSRRQDVVIWPLAAVEANGRVRSAAS